jgi:2,4-dienoyl-CoA reductase-like NADH-dependent reductase (Old Yellow Enzyme family)
MFVGSAKLVEKAGWDGVQIHSAHGYLLAEFLSPLVSLMVAMRGTSF